MKIKILPFLPLMMILSACESPQPSEVKAIAPQDAPAAQGSDPVAPTPTPSSTATPAPTATPTPATSSTPTPTPTPSGPTVTKSASNANHTCNIMSDGTIECSGDNTYNQAPTQVIGVPGPSDISVGTTISCAIGSDANSYCWGAGAYLGNGTSQVDSVTPIKNVSSGNVTALSAYGNYACALVGGIPTCWGSSAVGSLESYPSQDAGVISDSLTKIAVANGMKCVAGANLWCWSASHAVTKQTQFGAGAVFSTLTQSGDKICTTGFSGGVNFSKCYTVIQANGILN